MTRISGLNYECRYEESARCIAAAVRGHELPYLTQTLRSDAMAMKENYKLGHVEVVKMMSQAGA